jgi:GT2 family glycosyltransferase
MIEEFASIRKHLRSHSSKVCILLVNYNNWLDTIECLESILRLTWTNYAIVVVDNLSTDDSLFYLKKWIKGELNRWIKPLNPLRKITFPPVKKPLAYGFISKEDSVTFKNRISNFTPDSELFDTNTKITLIENYQNRGFAAGINVGLKYILKYVNFNFVWILNNDTVVDNKSLKYLLEKYYYLKIKNHKVSIIGSKILFYKNPAIIQCAGGGRYNKFLGLSKHVGEYQIDQKQYDKDDLALDYVMGASIFFPKEFLIEVGFLCEDYFLYYEELDWITRGRKKGWKAFYCWKSVVYHKAGQSSSALIPSKGKNVEYFALKNRLVFSRKFFPVYFPTVLLGFFLTLFNGIRRKQYYRVNLILKILQDFFVENWAYHR